MTALDDVNSKNIVDNNDGIVDKDDGIAPQDKHVKLVFQENLNNDIPTQRDNIIDRVIKGEFLSQFLHVQDLIDRSHNFPTYLITRYPVGVNLSLEWNAQQLPCCHLESHGTTSACHKLQLPSMSPSL